MFNSAISITYRRFFHKLDMIKDIRFPSRNDDPTPVVLPNEMFERLVTKWAGAKAKGVEQNQQLIPSTPLTLKLVPYESGGEGEGVNTLQALFKQFVESIESHRSLIDRLENDKFPKVVWGFCQTDCIALCKFFSHIVPSDVQGVNRCQYHSQFPI
ncbi:hypothetical protein BYT27DRAFT_7259683 [Phlegmacium glaucopus]|nr:hypothetical protein BYT27DRAFT_7259683 [Phlegmacium glaucopus]